MKVKKSSRKVNYAAKNAPQFCEIWFVNKGKLVWTRDASECPSSLPSCCQQQIEIANSFRSKSFQYEKNELIHTDSLRSSSAKFTLSTGISDKVQNEPVLSELTSSATISSSSSSSYLQHIHGSRSSATTSSSSTSGYSSAERRMSSDSELKIEEESLCNQLTDVRLEIEALRNKALTELLKRRKLESEAMETIRKVTTTFVTRNLHTDNICVVVIFLTCQ